MSDINTKTFGGIQVAVGGFPDGRPRVRDVDLGEWLGLARPTNIRNSIKKLISDRFINDSDVARVTCKPSVGPDASPEFGREVTEFWLTETQAMIVTARSESPKAVGMMQMLVAIFEAVTADQKRAGKILELCFTEVPRRVRSRFVPLLCGISRIRGCGVWWHRQPARMGPRHCQEGLLLGVPRPSPARAPPHSEPRPHGILSRLLLLHRRGAPRARPRAPGRRGIARVRHGHASHRNRSGLRVTSELVSVGHASGGKHASFITGKAEKGSHVALVRGTVILRLMPVRTSDRLPCANRADGFSAGFSCHWTAGQRMCYPWALPKKRARRRWKRPLAQHHRKEWFPMTQRKDSNPNATRASRFWSIVNPASVVGVWS